MRYLKLLAVGGILAISGCDFQKQADAHFGDQHFKTAIALIELHKVRNGAYPESLDDLRFTGLWDAAALGSVRYLKLDVGYELDLTRGWISKPELNYPPEFWRGLGVVKSNQNPGSRAESR